VASAIPLAKLPLLDLLPFEGLALQHELLAPCGEFLQAKHFRLTGIEQTRFLALQPSQARANDPKILWAP
jgi:hypothetical protein